MEQTKFKKDLKTGKKYENIALELIQKTYPKAYIIDGYCKEWDIYIPELKIGVEVKRDEQYKVTGNFYVEYFCNNKPSGISTTQSEYYFIYLDKLYVIETSKLKEKCRSYIDTYKDKPGGDDMASKGIILSLKELKELL